MGVNHIVAKNYLDGVWEKGRRLGRSKYTVAINLGENSEVARCFNAKANQLESEYQNARN